MKRVIIFIAGLSVLCAGAVSRAGDERRQLVQMPEMMQQHMLANMRDHLAAINEILLYMANRELDKAAEVAETPAAIGQAMDVPPRDAQ